MKILCVLGLHSWRQFRTKLEAFRSEGIQSGEQCVDCGKIRVTVCHGRIAFRGISFDYEDLEITSEKRDEIMAGWE